MAYPLPNVNCAKKEKAKKLAAKKTTKSPQKVAKKAAPKIK